MSKHVCIHGHFYQPLRENPWLEVVEVQDSATPFHDWNERITAECYAPNTAARIMGQAGRITEIVNNYERISFNFGATLLSWMQQQAPETYEAILAADRSALKRWGQGGAMAQIYHHLIMPLCNHRDKATQIAWGLADFQHRYGRHAKGMWLSETAADSETLDLMAQAGLQFTILAPSQCARVRPSPDQDWPEIDAGVDTTRPYLVRLKQGRSITVFFYQDEVSRAVAFEHLLNDGARFASRIMGAFDHDGSAEPLINLATDGESYGHHHRFGEMALAFALEKIDKDHDVELTNYAAYLEKHPAVWEAQIVENSSWSCAHGVERWRADCGCNTGANPSWNQRWRAPLRQGLNQLRDRLAALFEAHGKTLFHDPWAARDGYVRVMLDQSEHSRRDFLSRQCKAEPSQAEAVKVWQLLEMQRWAMAMFTSCGWFFDDISGIEPVQNLRMAARAIQLAGALGADGLEEELIAILAQTRSNRPAQGSGADIWQIKVAPEMVDVTRVAAHAAISGVLEQEPPPAKLYCYDLEPLEHVHRDHLGLALSWGRMRVCHRRIGCEQELIYAALHQGGQNFSAWVGPDRETWSADSFAKAIAAPMAALDTDSLEKFMRQDVGGPGFGLADLFLEGRRSLAQEMAQQMTRRHAETARHIFDESRDLMLMLQRINVPMPPLFKALAQAMITDDLVRGMDRIEGDELAAHLGGLARQARRLGLNLENNRLERAVARHLAECLAKLEAVPQELSAARQAMVLLDLSQALELRPDLWEAQNLCFRLGRRTGWDLPEQIKEITARLNIALSGQ